MDMKSLLMGLAGKDHPTLSSARLVDRWHQEIACEKIIDGVCFFCSFSF
jgi:hypothetical protein